VLVRNLGKRLPACVPACPSPLDRVLRMILTPTSIMSSLWPVRVGVLIGLLDEISSGWKSLVLMERSVVFMSCVVYLVAAERESRCRNPQIELTRFNAVLGYPTALALDETCVFPKKLRAAKGIKRLCL
jgi:hypothetical protein